MSSEIRKHDRVQADGRYGIVTHIESLLADVEFNGDGVKRYPVKDLELVEIAIQFTVYGTEFLVYEDPPNGWKEWHRGLGDYRYARARHLRRDREIEEHLVELARTEPQPEVLIGEFSEAREEPVLIRTFYGPLKNVPHATFLVCDLRHHLCSARSPSAFLAENAPSVHEVYWSGNVGAQTKLAFVYGADSEREAVVHHDPKLWRPKRYVAELLKLVAKYGPGTVIFFVHANKKVTVTADGFQKWRDAFDARPERALVDARFLLGA